MNARTRSFGLSSNTKPKRLARLLGPGLLVAVGYMDPGNWSTDIAAGSGYGYDLLFVVIASSIAAMFLQSLALRLGLVSGLDLAQASRRRYRPTTNLLLWALAEIAMIATDVAEVLGGALAIKLLLGLPMWFGILLTGVDMVLVVGLKGRGLRQIEAIVGALVGTIALCLFIELVIMPPDVAGLAKGILPDLARLRQPGALALAIGIVGATVMPHNLYLHSSLVRGRATARDPAALGRALRMANLDSAVSLFVAMLVNGAILALAASAFHASGLNRVTEIDDAYHLLTPIAGAKLAAVLFGIALLASGQSSTFTGTIAGQVVLEGFLKLRLTPWKRRAITRISAIVPAMTGVVLLGDHAVGQMLIVSQIVLALQLPFAIWPLVQLSGDGGLMRGLPASPHTRRFGWLVFAVILSANVWLLLNLGGIAG